MSHVLHLDASPRGERSHSRKLSGEFVAAWKDAYPGDTITYRDLGREPVPPVSEAWIAAVYSAPDTHTPDQQAAISVSDTLVRELQAADVYVFGVPMYNFSVPGSFKSYVDQIVRPGQTVAFTETGPKGLLTDKKMVVLTARGLGGYGPGGAMESINFQDPYLRAIFGYIGVTDITFIHGNNTMGGDLQDASLSEARAQIQGAVARLSGR